MRAERVRWHLCSIALPCSDAFLRPFLSPDDGLFKNGTGANVLEYMFPIEVLRIEPGTVWGTDRIVTSKSGEP